MGQPIPPVSLFGGDMLTCQNISVTYGTGESRSDVLQDVSISLGLESAALIGASGSGKSTLLRVLAGQQKPTSGRVRDKLTSNRGEHRSLRVSLIYQDYRLVPFLTVRENIELAAELSGVQKFDKAATTHELLNSVDLDGFQERMPDTLSGGQQQRVAIARALATAPTVLLADEPTGALDEANSANIAKLLSEMPARANISVLVATHDPQVFNQMGRVLRLSNGSLLEDSP